MGLVSWLAVGGLLGWIARRVLPGRPRAPFLDPVPSIALGATGGLGGGLVATGLGFGGLGARDPRALILAALVALVLLLLARWPRSPAR